MNNADDAMVKDIEASTDSSDSSPKSARIVAVERKMDQMSKELQTLQKEKAQLKVENQRLRQSVDDIQLGQHQQNQDPQAVPIAETRITIPDGLFNKSSPPSRNSNKGLLTAVVCILLLAGAIAGGVLAAVRNAESNESTSMETAASPTYSPTISTIQDDFSVLLKTSFVVDQVQDNGRTFTVPASTFPLYIDGSQDNPSNRTTIRMWNARTNTVKGVMLELVSGKPSTRHSRSSRQNQVVRGYYNTQELTQPNDFQPGDELVAVDYRPFLPDGGCASQEFGILGVNDELEWGADPGNIRIGRIGVVGDSYSDFEYTFQLNKPVTALWTDAVGIDIEYNSQSSLGYQRLVPREEGRPIRYFLDGPVSGTVKISFKGASLTNLNGLVTQGDAGGLHVAFCTDKSGSSTRPPRPSQSPTTCAEDTSKFGPQLTGYCVQSNGADQNSGVVLLMGGDYGNTQESKDLCLQACACYDGAVATGCEMIWSQSNKGCYVHTQEVSRGQGSDLHWCHIALP